MLTRVHHVGLVVRRLEGGLAFWQGTLGLPIAKQATIQDQGVRAALLPIGRSEIELLEPVDDASGVAKFLARRGEGLHHVCFETPDVAAELATARGAGLPVIDETPRPGLAGLICFLHPKGTAGVLVEFATPPPGEHPDASAGAGSFAGIALREVTVQSRDAVSAATVFVTRLGLARGSAEAAPGVTAAAVTTGGVCLKFLSADPGSSSADASALRRAVESVGDGLAGLVLEVPDLPAAGHALRVLPEGDIRLDAARCHGVPLTFRAAS